MMHSHEPCSTMMLLSTLSYRSRVCMSHKQFNQSVFSLSSCMMLYIYIYIYRYRMIELSSTLYKKITFCRKGSVGSMFACMIHNRFIP